MHISSLWTQALHNEVYTCSIGCTTRLNFLDNNALFTVSESLIWKFSCLHAFMCMRACLKLQSHVGVLQFGFLGVRYLEATLY